MKQNRKAQKLLTLFRHRERDKWSDAQRERYGTMQTSEDKRNREDSILHRMQHEVSQQPLPTATIRLYNLQLSYCHQVKLALTEYQGNNSSANVDEENYFDNYNSKCALLKLSKASVELVRQHIKNANNYTLHDNSSNDAVSNSISDSIPTHNQHRCQQQPTTTTSLVNKLNNMQQKVFNIFKTFLDSTEENDNIAPYLVLLGGPGTGKSFVVKCLQEYYESNRHASSQHAIITCANFGFPAVLIGGQTIFSLLGIKSWMIKETEVEIPALPVESLHTKKSALKHMKLLVIDEISTVPPPLLYAIDVRLRQIFSSEHKFGGIAVLALGDLMQLGPVGGSHLAVSCVEYATNMHRGSLKLQAEKYRPETIWTKGTAIFTEATVLNLTQQQRAIHDTFHTNIIQKLHNGQPFKMEDLEQYKLLTKEDMTGQGEFRFAPILVSSNRERIDISYSQLKQYALVHNIPIVKWKSKHQNWQNSPEDTSTAIENDCAFFEYFCVGLPGFLRHNISNSLKLANGTPVELRSLQFQDVDMQTKFNTDYHDTEPGKEILLPSPPDFLTYMPYPDDEKFHAEWTSKNWPTLDDQNKCVLLLLEHNWQFNKYKSYPIEGAAYEEPSSVEICSYFSFLMGFAQTIHKAEGRTLDKVILSLTNVRKFIKFSQIFVAFSRVAHHEDIRLLLPIGTTHELISYITNLKQDPKILIYLKCINENNKFDAEWIVKHVIQKKKKNFPTRKL